MEQCIERRLAKLERSNRILAVFCILAFGAFLAAATSQRDSSEVIKARRFELIDEGGVTRSSWASTTIGSALTFHDNKGSARSLIGFVNGAPRLLFSDDQSSPRVLITSESKAGFLALYHGGQKPLLDLSVTPDGPSLRLNDRNGTLRSELAVWEDGSRLRQYDEEGELRSWLAARKQGPSLALTDKSNKEGVVLSCRDNGPQLVFADKGGVNRAALAVLDGQPRLELMDAKGNPVSRFPNP